MIDEGAGAVGWQSIDRKAGLELRSHCGGRSVLNFCRSRTMAIVSVDDRTALQHDATRCAITIACPMLGHGGHTTSAATVVHHCTGRATRVAVQTLQAKLGNPDKTLGTSGRYHFAHSLMQTCGHHASSTRSTTVPPGFLRWSRTSQCPTPGVQTGHWHRQLTLAGERPPGRLRFQCFRLESWCEMARFFSSVHMLAPHTGSNAKDAHERVDTTYVTRVGVKRCLTCGCQPAWPNHCPPQSYATQHRQHTQP